MFFYYMEEFPGENRNGTIILFGSYDDYPILNEEFLLSAIREKLERDREEAPHDL